MSDHDDDLKDWRNEPIVQALTSPGSPAELSGEAAALAAFRASVADTDPIVAALTAPGTPAELAGEAAALAAFTTFAPRQRSRRRYLRSVGVGGAAAATAIALSSGAAAAAYTSSLPRPVQNFVAHVTNPLGPLAVPTHKPKATTRATGSPGTVTPVPSPTTSPTAVTTSPTTPVVPGPHTSPPTKPSPHHTKPAVTPTPTPTLTPPTTPTPTPTDTPTPTPSPTETSTPSGGSITIALSATTVAPGGTVTVYGHVANADGTPVAGEQVWLLQATAGETGASQVDAGVTGDDGNVSLTTTTITHSVRLRLVAGDKEKSASIGVAVQATIMATVAESASAASIQIATTGAAPGDSVTIQRRVDGIWQDVATNQLDETGHALFGVQPPAGPHPDHWRAVLPHSKAHTGAITRFDVAPT